MQYARRQQAATIITLLGLLIFVPVCVAWQNDLSKTVPQSPELDEAGRLHQQIEKLYGEGRHKEAVPLAQRGLAIRESILGSEHPLVAESIEDLAHLYRELKDYVRAESLYQRSLSIREKTQGSEHPDVGRLLNNFARLYQARGQYAQAEPLLQRVLAMREKASGPEHPDTATSLNNLALLYYLMGDYTRAEPLFRRALALREKSFGPDHSGVALVLNNLAGLHREKGDYVRAEPLFQRALAIREKLLGPEHPAFAVSLDNLAGLYQLMGDYARAEGLFRRALAIREKAQGPEHLSVAISLNNLAVLYHLMKEYEREEPAIKRALAISEKALGPDHIDVGRFLNNLALLHLEKSEFERAEPFFQRALAINERALGPGHIEVGRTLNNLAALHFAKGDYLRSEPLHRRGFAILEKALGPEHPTVCISRNNLAQLYDAKGEIRKAAAYLNHNNEIRERNLATILSTVSERQKLLYMATLSDETDYTITFHTRSAPKNSQAARLALTTILRRKGRVLDVMSGQIESLRRRLDPGDGALLDQLSSARTRLATLIWEGPEQRSREEHRAEVAKLEEGTQRMEASVSVRSAQFRAQSQAVTLADVQKAIPAGAALVEIASFRPFNARAGKRSEIFGPSRYVAYVVRREGPPRWVELGEGTAIDAGVMRLRGMLSDPGSGEVRRAARALDEMVMRPVRRALGGARAIFLSPDGALNLLSFGALVDERNRYLLELYSFTYLTSGRDLLRLRVKTKSRGGPIIIADPSFDSKPADVSGVGTFQRPPDDKSLTPATNQSNAGPRYGDYWQAFFTRLPGTAREAQDLRTILGHVRLMTEAQATESELKRASGPSILHIATHGFFLPDEIPQDAASYKRGVTPSPEIQTQVPQSVRIDNPLLRSGLALAGANQRQSAGGEDGILTALEACGLDLWGTKLVVLSACDTGVGDIKSGEGVYGLRRALVLAGAESQVISLWRVSDAAARDMMVEYYKRLKAGEGRAEALREVQLQMLRNRAFKDRAQSRGLRDVGGGRVENRSHPFYWASFIQSGAWTGIQATASRRRRLYQ